MTTVRTLTPRGRGAIAVIEVDGPEAVELVDRWFEAANGRPVAEAPIDAIRFGRWRRAEGGPGEELVVVRTADDRVEVHCHGGQAASSAITKALGESGAQPGSEAAVSLTDQARLTLAQAPTERCAAILLDQASGALDRTLVDILAAEDEVARRLLDELLGRERLGLHLTKPWRVVLAGPPNVGKSSLINALVGYGRALVYDQPGTTRDVITASTAVAGWPVTLADTAGVRETDDPLEAAGVERARETLRSAEIVIVVREAATFESAGSVAARASILSEVRGDFAIVDVASKTDLSCAELPNNAVATAAPSGEGVRELVAAIERAIDLTPPPRGSAIPFEPWQFETLRAAAAATAPERRRLLLALQAGERP